MFLQMAVVWPISSQNKEHEALPKILIENRLTIHSANTTKPNHLNNSNS